MSRSSSIFIGPVTYGHLRADHKLVEVGCRCGRVSYLDASALLFSDDVPVPGSQSRFVCSKCGQRASYVRPDARVANCDGSYPAF